MFTRAEILSSPEYWFEDAQNELYRQVVEYMEREGLNQTELAKRLGVTKGYVSQILKGEFNYTLKKLIEISLAIGKIPKIEYVSASKFIKDDARPVAPLIKNKVVKQDRAKFKAQASRLKVGSR